jgi:hypothetical protein
MTTVIWIEPVKRPDGSKRYTDRGLLLRTRLGGPEGEFICDGVQNAVCETCRVLMSRGITGPFETWKEAVRYPCMREDIASTAELTVHEPDDGVVHFAKWRPFAQNAVSRSAVLAPALEKDVAGTGRTSRYERLSLLGCAGIAATSGIRLRRASPHRDFPTY